ncbi:MAG: hypothetical protein DWH91_15240 [Planctomycetota bacterium]|nr:MAG: hypothetical protein DWH91_15240 [Planctomycetota bacterium]
MAVSRGAFFDRLPQGDASIVICRRPVALEGLRHFGNFVFGQSAETRERPVPIRNARLVAIDTSQTQNKDGALVMSDIRS